MIRIFSNKKELRTYPITQDENGVYHKNLTYSSGVPQLALDFGNQKVGYPITMNVDVKVTFRASNAGNYIVVQYGSYKFMFVHVYKHAALGSTVKKGAPICYIAPTTYNGGYAVHLHTSARKDNKAYAIRKILYATEVDPCQIYKNKITSLTKQLAEQKKISARYETQYMAAVDKYNEYEKEMESRYAETLDAYTKCKADLALCSEKYRKDTDALKNDIKTLEEQLKRCKESKLTCEDFTAKELWSCLFDKLFNFSKPEAES